MVVVGRIAREVAHQVEMDGFLVLRAVQIEPVRDVRKLGEDLGPTARFLANFAQGRLLVGLAGLDVALRQRPDARLAAPDQARLRGYRPFRRSTSPPAETSYLIRIVAFQKSSPRFKTGVLLV